MKYICEDCLDPCFLSCGKEDIISPFNFCPFDGAKVEWKPIGVDKDEF